MKELLVPAGNMDCLHAAILNGADAVYLGGLKYGARAFASNFSDEELIEAIKLAHLYGVKIYVTVNTLIHSSEVNKVLEYVEFLHKNNVDALIIQDIGLMYLIKNRFPNLEIHSSTQTHTTNINTINFFKKLGVKRCVLARELSLEEIKKLDTDLELEAFIHGALCVCYSGECLFSSRIFNRSANRGECAGVCRLPFKIDNKEAYYLSCKELNTSNYFYEIMNSNIKSLKIEGRMKSAEYVGCVTRFYRDLMDKYYSGKPVIPNENMLKDLQVIYNREFTCGYLFNEKNIINKKFSNHQGLKIGKIIKKDNKYITIKLTEELNQGDGIRFKETNEGLIVNYLFDENKKLINKADNIVLIKNTFNVKKGDVYKTSGIKLIEKYTKNLERKISINVEFKAIKDKPMELILNDGVNIVNIHGSIPEISKTISINEEDIKKQLFKINNTIYNIENIKINVENNLFINKKFLNELRNEAINKLCEIRMNTTKEVIINNYAINNSINNEPISFSVLVRNEQQLKKVLGNFDRIYIDDYILYEKYKGLNNVYFKTNRVVENREYQKGLVTELGSVKNNSIGDYYLNITNEYSLEYLNQFLKFNTLSIELDDKEIENIVNKNNNFELVIYTNIDLMITKNKIENDYIIDRNNNKYKIINEDNIMHIIDNKVIDKIDLLDSYIKMGINKFRIELLDQDDLEIDEIKKRIFN